jgi:hypothetical protein
MEKREDSEKAVEMGGEESWFIHYNRENIKQTGSHASRRDMGKGSLQTFSSSCINFLNETGSLLINRKDHVGGEEQSMTELPRAIE